MLRSGMHGFSDWQLIFQKKTPFSTLGAPSGATIRMAPLVADRIAAAFPKAHVSHEALEERIFDCLAKSRKWRRKFRDEKFRFEKTKMYDIPGRKEKKSQNEYVTNLSCSNF